MRGSSSVTGLLFAAAGALALHAGGPDAISIGTDALPPLPDQYGFAGCFAGLCDGMLVAAGGANFPDGIMPWDGGRKVWHRNIHILDLANPQATWQAAGMLPDPCGYGVCLPAGNGLLLIGGSNATSHSAAVLFLTLNGGTAHIAALPPLPIPLAHHSGVRLGRYIHIIGGTTTPDACTASPRHFALDSDNPAAGWRELAPLPGDGVHLALIGTHSGGILVAGGASLAADDQGKPKRRYLSTTWWFDNASWQRRSDLPNPLLAAATPAWPVGDALLVVGGDDGSQVGSVPATHRGFSRKILAYLPAQDRWHEAATINHAVPVTVPAVLSGDSCILVSGEIRPGVRTPAVTRFHLAKP